MKTGQGRPQGKGLGTGLKGSAPGLLAVDSQKQILSFNLYNDRKESKASHGLAKCSTTSHALIL